jgi:lipopolysaccharide/colanic/teichoic acid biosynthesis glycosyltransferase
MLFTPGIREGEHLRRRAAAPRRTASPAVQAPASWYVAVKAGAEFVIALVLLVPALPVMLLAALLIKLTSPGPVVYTQTRLGRNGRPYTIRKLRTMVHDCERHSGPRWSAPYDPRVTPLGRVLRNTHLDELPQLWNVLCGDMSLVGPRPERPEFVPQLQRSIPCYRDRLLVRPGITGLAQVQVPADTDLASVRRKLAYDLYYIGALGPWLDLRLLACTGLSLVGVPFAVSCRLLRVPGGSAVDDAYEALVGRVQPPPVPPSPPSPAAGGGTGWGAPPPVDGVLR